MGFSIRSDHVRVDFFRESGKWYATEEVEWIGPWKADGAPLIWDQFNETLERFCQLGSRYRYTGMTAVCLEPYHEHAFPLMVSVNRAIWEANQKKGEHHAPSGD